MEWQVWRTSNQLLYKSVTSLKCFLKSRSQGSRLWWDLGLVQHDLLCLITTSETTKWINSFAFFSSCKEVCMPWFGEYHIALFEQMPTSSTHSLYVLLDHQTRSVRDLSHVWSIEASPTVKAFSWSHSKIVFWLCGSFMQEANDCSQQVPPLPKRWRNTNHLHLNYSKTKHLGASKIEFFQIAIYFNGSSKQVPGREFSFKRLAYEDLRERESMEWGGTAIHEKPRDSEDGTDDGHANEDVLLVAAIEIVFHPRSESSSSSAASAVDAAATAAFSCHFNSSSRSFFACRSGILVFK